MSGSTVVPGIAIRIGKSSAPASTAPAPAPVGDAEDLANNLHGVYMQVVKGSVRKQWVVFPPPLEVLGVNMSRQNGGDPSLIPKYCYMYRTQNHAGNRSKWFHAKIWDSSRPISNLIEDYTSTGWEPSDPVVVPLEVDDYLKVWNEGVTPQKYIRAIEKTLKPFGLTVK